MRNLPTGIEAWALAMILLGSFAGGAGLAMTIGQTIAEIWL